jgi:excisionase family DNA binding protein
MDKNRRGGAGREHGERAAARRAGRYLTAAGAARYLKLSRAVVERALEEGKLSGSRVHGRWRVDRRRLPDSMTPAMWWLRRELRANARSAYRKPTAPAARRPQVYLAGIAAALLGAGVITVLTQTAPDRFHGQPDATGESANGSLHAAQGAATAAAVTHRTPDNLLDPADRKALVRSVSRHRDDRSETGESGAAALSADSDVLAASVPGTGCPPGAAAPAASAPAAPPPPAPEAGGEADTLPISEAADAVASQVDVQAPSLGVETAVEDLVKTTAGTVDQLPSEDG